jgi:hypothetical protein
MFFKQEITIIYGGAGLKTVIPICVDTGEYRKQISVIGVGGPSSLASTKINQSTTVLALTRQ